MIDQLLAKKAELQAQIDAIDLLIKSFGYGQPEPNKIRKDEGVVGQAQSDSITKLEPSRGTVGRKLAPHEGITEGTTGDCTTTFVTAGPGTTFTRAKVLKDGRVAKE